MPTLGPGILTLSVTNPATELDLSCLVNNVRITAAKNQDDPKTKLCGTVTPGKITYDYSLTGNLDVDSNEADGVFAYSQAHAGEQVNFTFVPSTAAATVAQASGVLTIDPLDFGADEYGAAMDSDFEFSIVGKPTYTYAAPPAPGAAAEPAEAAKKKA